MPSVPSPLPTLHTENSLAPVSNKANQHLLQATMSNRSPLLLQKLPNNTTIPFRVLNIAHMTRPAERKPF